MIRWDDAADLPWGPLDSDGEDALDALDLGSDDEDYPDIVKSPEDLVRRPPTPRSQIICLILHRYDVVLCSAKDEVLPGFASIEVYNHIA